MVVLEHEGEGDYPPFERRSSLPFVLESVVSIRQSEITIVFLFDETLNEQITGPS